MASRELKSLLDREDLKGLEAEAHKSVSRVLRFLTSRLYGSDDEKFRAVRALGHLVHNAELVSEWRVAELRGHWYVLGHHSVVPCGSERAALGMLAELERRSDADRLASEVIAGLDLTPDGWESETLGESEIA